MAKVELERCTYGRLAALEAMFQLYTHDFSERWAGQARGELQEDGRFEAYPGLDRFAREADRSAWFIRADGHLAGFALLSGHSHSGEAADYDVAEFFVVRKHRRSGVGSEAARQLIARRPGMWEIAVARSNAGALAFWRRVAARMAPEVEERDINDARWNGAILRFVVVGGA